MDESIAAVVDPSPEHMATEDPGPLVYEPVVNVVEPASQLPPVDEEPPSVAVESALEVTESIVIEPSGVEDPLSLTYEPIASTVESASVDGEPSATASPVPEATELSFESVEAEIVSSAMREPRPLSDPSLVPPEPVSAAVEPGPMFDFGATEESSQEKAPRE
jgi:hypothetical protein